MAVQAVLRNQPRKARFPDGFRVMQGQQEFITYPDHSSIRVWPSDQSGHFEAHVHSAVEIIMPSHGVSVVRLPDREYRVKADEILITSDTVVIVDNTAVLHRRAYARIPDLVVQTDRFFRVFRRFVHNEPVVDHGAPVIPV